jgi:beta-glucuronidase
MKHFSLSVIIAVCLFFFVSLLFGQEPQIINVEGRTSLNLNGYWKYIVDPYQTGYYDYRQQVRDQSANPGYSESIFLGYKQQHPSERVEYDFDKADNILVPRDWNSQKEKLFYYEGAVWYYKAFDFVPTKGNRQFLYF